MNLLGPTVSVYMVTFNHLKYIEQAIESVVTQKTDFPFELIIADDCSTDRTTEIIERWHKSYPQIIKPFYHTINLGAQRNFSKIIERCQGMYTAILDGDDYWCSKEKLQKQVDFMKQNPELSSSYHRTKVFNEESKSFTAAMPPSSNTVEQITIHDLFNDYFIPSSSVMFKTGLFRKFPEWYFELPIGDRPLHILNSHHGPIGFLNEEMSVYRIHSQGIWSLKHYDELELHLNKKIFMLQQFDHYFEGAYHEDIHNAISRYRILLAIEKIKVNNEQAAKEILADLMPERVRYRKNNKKVVIFGTGQFAVNFIKLCGLLGIQVAYCVDNDTNRQGNHFQQLPILAPSALLSEDKTELSVFICSMYYKDISSQLVKMDFVENVHYFDGLNSEAIMKIL
ncbi:glycosyltransferase [Cohnella thailandensis]|uniref:Glycosyltransferase n=1 Tax=Cohnella thailandensis TaxID=557557 RepID=A0A841SV61_9BACL|nr:glycosyltransferase [Cohnella thailandensis]MBB6632571.1 glycosyltransferase [Cohnella thailandensis]MBP1971865.1 glycosyltransferase involved in cell wall biosynthesis [Cohnella thailandensis]